MFTSVHPSPNLGSFLWDSHLERLDDWLVLTSSRVKLIQDRDRLLKFCRSFSIVINLEKSNPSPSQRILYLGMIIDTTAAKVFPSDQRLVKFRSIAQSFLSKEKHPAHQSSVAVYPRLLGIPRKAGSSRSSSPSLSSMETEGILVPFEGFPHASESSVKTGKARLSMVARRREPDPSGASSLYPSGNPSVLGCLIRRLGSALGRSNIRTVGSPRETITQ